MVNDNKLESFSAGMAELKPHGDDIVSARAFVGCSNCHCQCFEKWSKYCLLRGTILGALLSKCNWSMSIGNLLANVANGATARILGRDTVSQVFLWPNGSQMAVLSLVSLGQKL